VVLTVPIHMTTGGVAHLDVSLPLIAVLIDAFSGKYRLPSVEAEPAPPPADQAPRRTVASGRGRTRRKA
jgi:hypothetical protein